MRTTPDASPEQLGLLVEQRAEFASTCCPATSPPLYCTSKVKPPPLLAVPCPWQTRAPRLLPPLLQVSVALGNTCKGGSCLLV